MQSFFKSSYYFWVVSRIVLIVVGFICVVQIFSDVRLDNYQFIANALFFIYLILLIVCSIKELRGFKTRSVINIVTGSISLLLGLALLVTFIVIGPSRINVNILIPVLLSLWIMFIGLFDIFKPTNNE